MNPFACVLDVIAPRRCIVCQCRIDDLPRPICAGCDRRLAWWRRADGCPRCGLAWSPVGVDDGSDEPARGDDPACPRCLANGSALHLCHAACRYEGILRAWIPAYKNTPNVFGPSVAVRVAIDYLADELAERVVQGTRSRPDLVVPIPLHPRRERARGFNHAERIASRVARILGCAWTTGVLERVRDTRPQATRVGAERASNLRGAFRARATLGADQRVWLVDDVLTTGSTLESAAEALLDAGAEEVRALTLAATLPSPRRLAASHRPSAPGRAGVRGPTRVSSDLRRFRCDLASAW